MQEKTNGFNKGETEKDCMSFEGFAKCIQMDVQKEKGNSCRVYIDNVIKNNDLYLTGLIISTEDCNISPTIYLEPYYEQYADGEPYESILKDIISVYEEHKVSESIDTSFFTVWDKVKRRIIFKLVNRKANEELLKQVPYVEYLDFAVIFYCLVDTPCNEMATILIHNHHLRFWNAGVEALYEAAMENTPKLLPHRFGRISDLIAESMFEEERETMQMALDYPVYILTNQRKINGAGCILYPDVLRYFSEMVGYDLYIIPSSVHETLLIPIIEDSEGLNDMINEVNCTQLTPDEILSDHFYKYTRVTGKITM